MPSQRDPAALKWCPQTLNTRCVSVNTGDCAYANKMQHNQLLKLRKNGKREETIKGGLWKHPLHTCGVRPCWQQQLYYLLGFHTNSPSDFIPYFSPPPRCLKVGKMKEQVEVPGLSCSAAAGPWGAAVRKSSPCSEELAGVPKLLRFLEIAKNKVEIWGGKILRKLGRRGLAIVWSDGRSLGANASASKGMRLPISQVWVKRGEVSC